MIRKANEKDIDKVMDLINDAKQLFKSKGSSQWQDTDSYPSQITMLNDIKFKRLFVEVINTEITGCIVLTDEKEECYNYIYDGNWHDNGDYLVIHRVATKKAFYHQGVGSRLISWALDEASRRSNTSIRVDTKEDNTLMHALLIKNGFKVVGKIKILRTGCIDPERIAYEYIIEKSIR